jgi:hypothetical protein
VRSSVISQTFRQEIEGGYLWSPKRNKNGHRNPFYEFMREVAPGDIVFSFFDTRIAALGIVGGFCRESPKPEEFGNAGANWSQIGWRVGVAAVVSELGVRGEFEYRYDMGNGWGHRIVIESPPASVGFMSWRIAERIAAIASSWLASFLSRRASSCAN